MHADPFAELKKRHRRSDRSILVAIMLLVGLAPPSAAFAAAPSSDGMRVLVFSRTAGFRHESIPDAVAAIRKLGAKKGWHVDATEDATWFNDAKLSNFDVTVWLMTSRDVLNDEQQAAFERFIRAGNGIASIHEGTDTEYDWPWYGELIGGTYFAAHPRVQEARLRIEDRDHPSTASLPATWLHTDEYYNFRASPRAHVRVLLSVQESTYEAGEGAMGVDHPIAWARYYDGGRSFHTALGHTKESYQEEAFLAHIAGGIAWAGGRFTRPGLPPGAVVVLEEFDAIHPPGIWDIHNHPSQFHYEVRKDALLMSDHTVGYAAPNQHLTRRKFPLNPQRPYAVESQITIHVDGTESDPSSFCYNVNVAGADGDFGPISTWSVPIDYHHEWPPSVTKFAGFNNGVFFALGQKDLPWCRQNREYTYRLAVNADLHGKTKSKTVSVLVKEGAVVVETTQADYSKSPYQPPSNAPVRLGVNTHGGNWTMKNLRVFYLPLDRRR